MKDKRRIYLTSFVGIVGTIALGIALLAPSIYGGGYNVRHPLLNDWSHQHLVFSPPSGLAQTWKVQQQVRYQLQWARLHANQSVQTGFGNSWGEFMRREFGLQKTRLLQREPVTRDWAFSFNSLTGIGTVGKGMYPAKYTWNIDITPSCANDYVAMNTSLPGSASTPNVVAFNNLYSGTVPATGICGSGGPSVVWSYNTGSGVAATSIVLSYAGDKIAFIEQPGTINSSGNLVASGAAVLRVVEWHAGDSTTITSTAAPAVTFANDFAGDGSNHKWTQCTAGESCMISVAFQNGDSDTRSSVYYDYGSDAIYVGDNEGVLHKFTGVFKGTPAEVTASWPITVDAGKALASPVYDETSGNIFVGDAAGNFSYVREVGSTAGTCSSGSTPCFGATQALGNSARLAGVVPNGIVDAPLVDSTLGKVYAFDGHTLDLGVYGAVFQFDTALSSGSELETSFGANEAVTTTGSSSDMYAGTFDNNYFTSSSGDGYLYVCGKWNARDDRPLLGQIPIGSGLMNSGNNNQATVQVSTGVLLADGSDECSPVTEVFNSSTSTDWIFFSVGNQSDQAAAGCIGPAPLGSSSPGCIMSLNLTTGCGGIACTSSSWPPASGLVTAGVPTAPGPTYTNINATANSAGTSGIIIDNVAAVGTFPQAASIYFTWIGPASNGNPNTSCNSITTGGCAVKLTQNGLQ
jgi:hypothetical protein